MRNITITTDAGFHPLYNLGTYGIWISSNCGTFKFSGTFKNKCIDSYDAEFKCIVLATWFLKNRTSIKINLYDTLIINTDNQGCQRVINKDNKKKQRASILKIYNKFLDIVKDFKSIKTIHSRHVKAHSHGRTPRSWVNNWCDAECTRHQKLEIEKIKNDSKTNNNR